MDKPVTAPDELEHLLAESAYDDRAFGIFLLAFWPVVIAGAVGLLLAYKSADWIGALQ